MNHPNYYTWVPGTPCHTLVPHFPFLRGNALKYIYRAGKKDPDKEVEDLRKAIHSLEMEVERLTGHQTVSDGGACNHDWATYEEMPSNTMYRECMKCGKREYL